MRVLVTGAGGFIGRHVVARLRASGHSVKEHVHRTHGELRPKEFFEGCEVAVNCAGRLGGQGAGPREMRRANVELPRSLAKTCAERGTYLVHLSTPGVAGLRPEGREDDPPAPWGPYEQTKAEAEELLDEAMEPGRLTVLRPDFVYGPGDLHKLAMFRQAARGWFPLVGRGGARLRPTFVTDVARAVEASLPGGMLAGGLYNIGGPRVLSVRQLLEAISSALGKRVAALPLPRPLLLAVLRLGPLTPRALSPSRLRLFGKDHYVAVDRAGAAGFVSRVGPGEGTRRTVSWYRQEGLL